MDDDRPPSLSRGLWLRFAIAAVLIIGLSGVATATVALNKATSIAEELFPKAFQIKTPKGLVAPLTGGAQTFLVLGSDRRSGSKNTLERTAAPRSDTILLVRFDPSRGQTSVMSIPRDLMVNIRTPSGQLYANEKINAAYTIGGTGHGNDGGSVLAAETIEREVFPELKGHLNGIIDVNFAGFIKVVDALGCAYVNVDHRYYHVNAPGEEEFSEINLQPGYQKLCYNSALSYVRFRHFDSDLVRVARQQDFLRDLREQVSPEIESIDRIAKAVGHAIRTNFHASAGELILLSKLIAFSQSKPLRQVKFRYLSANATGPGGGSFVTSTPELEKQTLADFLNGTERVSLPTSHPASHSSKSHHHSSSAKAATPAAINLYPTTGESEAVTAGLHTPFPVLYPTLQLGSATQQTVRPYALRNFQHQIHFAYVAVWQTNMVGGYYDFEGTDWLSPPLFSHSHTASIGGHEYKLVDDGSHIHVIGWRRGKALYWLTNTLLEELSNSQMLAIAKSAQTLH